MIREILSDKNGVLSSKRIAGIALVTAGITAAFMKMDAESVQWLLIAGVSALGVGTFETKVNR